MAVLILGVMVILGWHINSPALVQVFPSLVPMQYNTALGFILCGIAQVAHARKQSVAVFLSASAVALIGILTLSQYVLNTNLGIDELLMEHAITVETSHPGRMAPNTALCFALTGTCFLVAAMWKRTQPWIFLLGGGVASLGLVALMGYIIGIPSAYGWGHLTSMALHTSLGFAVIGSGIYIAAWLRSEWLAQTHFLATSVGLFAVLTTVGLTQAMSSQSVIYQGNIRDMLALDIVADTRERLRFNHQAFERIARRWDDQAPVNLALWERDARRHLVGFPSITMLAIITESGDVISRVFNDQNQMGAPEQSDELIERIIPVLQQSSGQNLFANQEELPRHARMLAAYRIHHVGGDQKNGWLIITLSESYFLDRVLTPHRRLARVIPHPPGHTAPERTILQTEADHTLVHAHYQDIAWDFEVRLTQDYLAELQTRWPLTILISGALTSISLPVMVLLMQRHAQTRERHRQLIRELDTRQYLLDEASTVAIINTQHVITDANNSFCQRSGYSREELIGRQISSLACELGRSVFDAQIAQSISRRRIWKGETRQQRKDGETYWTESTIIPVADTDGQIEKCVVTQIDITAQKEAERSYQNEFATTQTILRNGVDGLHVSDENGNLLEVSDSFCATLGYTREEMLGMNITRWDALIPPEEVPKITKKHLREQKRVQFTTVHRRKDGSTFPVQIVGWPLVLNGKPATCYIAHDITESENAKRQILQSKQREDLARAAARVGVWEWNLQTNTMVWEKEMFLLYGMTPTPDGIVNFKDWEACVLEQDLDQQLDLLNQISEGEQEPGRRQFRIRRADNGEQRTLQAYDTVRRDEAGQVEAIIGTNWDITERIRIEEELRDKNEELENFVYSASHDLKSPLLTIQGFTELVRQDVKDQRYDRLEEFTATILRGTTRLRGNIDDLLELSRVGRVNTEFQSVDPTDVIHEVIEDIRVQIEEADARISVQPDIPAVYANQQRMSQAFQNLITNALNHARQEGTQLQIDIAAEQADDQVRIRVADNGPGIPMEYRQKVFGLFQRLDSSGQGTGVGLSLVRKIAETHGGKVWIETTPGGGATFVLELPVDRRPDPQRVDENPPGAQTRQILASQGESRD